MHTMVKSVAVLILAVAIVPFLAEWHTPFGGRDAGIAYAKGGGGGGGHGGGNSGGHDSDGGHEGGGGAHGGDHGSGRATSGHGTGMGGVGQHRSGHAVGNEVAEAATTTAHAGKAAAREAGFRNLGRAVSTEVHRAQRDRDRDQDRHHVMHRERERDRKPVGWLASGTRTRVSGASPALPTRSGERRVSTVAVADGD